MEKRRTVENIHSYEQKRWNLRNHREKEVIPPRAEYKHKGIGCGKKLTSEKSMAGKSV